MLRTSTLTAALLALGAAVCGASAEEWYVDNSGAPPCSDVPSGGSQTQPWCTIGFAVTQVRAGDVVYVKNGIYREDVQISDRDGGASYITFRNYPGHAPVIRGEGVHSGRNRISNSSFIRFVGFTITEFQQGLFVERSSNILLQNLHVHNIGQEAVRIRLNSSFVTIERSLIHDTRKWRSNGEGVYIGTSSSQQPASPPYDNTHDVLVRNNVIYNTGDECIEAKEGTYNVVIDGNTLHDCLLDPGITSPGWGAIEVMEHERYFGSNPNHVIKNNVIRMAKTGIGVHTGATVFNNVIYGQTGKYRGISIDNADADDYLRRIYHNTIDVPEARAVVVSGGARVDIRNNIGPATAGNIPAQDTFFVGRAAGDYRLVARSAPIDAGEDLTATVASDIAGVSRIGGPPDMGAYEFTAD
ncbi:MAG TPA: right-handed parallel beta-helix repeat-containing protein [Hyphomicrobiaceae bacterium]|nr:right-handed parallel beta-helix repeat-containing protein [Hyphomicrobiaceae bacterium]